MTAEQRAAEVVGCFGSELRTPVRSELLPLIADAIRAAEDAMRERCAKVADRHAEANRYESPDGRAVARDIAEAIRATGTNAAGGES